MRKFTFQLKLVQRIKIKTLPLILLFCCFCFCFVLFCFVFCRLPLDNKFPYFALKFCLFLILIPEGWEILAKDSLSCLIHYFNKLTTIRVSLHSKVFERRPRSQSPLLFVREDPGNEIIVSPAIIWLKWKINTIITFLLLRSLYSEKCTLSILCDA